MRIPKFFTRWWFWVGIILVLGVIGYMFIPRSPDVTYVTEIIERQDLLQTVDANGEVVSVDKVDLSFDLSGTLKQVLVEVGDAVQIGDVLAMLDTTELLANVQSAFQAVQVAQGNLNAQEAGSSDETINVTQKSYGVTQASLDSAIVDYENRLALVDLTSSRYQAEAGVQSAVLKTAQDNLLQVTQDNANLITDAYDDLLSASWAGAIEARSAISKGDEILGVHNSTLNDDYQNLLSSGNGSAVSQARTALLSAEASVASAETALLTVVYGQSGAIASTASYVESALDDGAVLLMHLRAAISAMPATGDLSVTEATTLASAVDASRASLQADQAGLQNAFQAVQGALQTSSSNLEDAQNAVAQASASYDASLFAKEYQVTSAQQSVENAKASLTLREAELAQAQASLDQVKAVPRVVDLASFQAEVARAQASYQSALARLDKAQILSPIIGDVTSISVEVGEQVMASSAVVTVQTTQEQFEVIADVSESDIAKLSIDDRALMTFDAFGSSTEIFGHVRKIDPAEKLIEGVVYYEVTISLDVSDQSVTLRPGLSADLIFTTEEQSQTLTVSQRALFSQGDRNYVRVIVNGTPQEREVTVGLRGDLGRIEILTGLEEGEEVVIREVTQ